MQEAGNKRYAVVTYMNEGKSGTLRLTLDDAEAEGEEPEYWGKRGLFTFIDIEEEKARSFQLGPEVYAAIGGAVVARLLALDAVLARKAKEPGD
jgi:hypothetical protein